VLLRALGLPALPAVCLVVALVPAAAAKPADRDRDGMADKWERRYKLNPKSKKDAKKDADRDRLKNAAEFKARTSPRRADTDRDGMRDRFEVTYKLNPRSRKDARRDPDKDGLTNRAEAKHRTNPRKADTDGDGMTDGYEVRHGFNPRRKDRPLSGAPAPSIGGPSIADADGDGYVDTSDQCPASAAPGTITGCSMGSIRYISPWGVDFGSCTRAFPCRTIAFADELLSGGGDAIVARGGTYTGQGRIRWGGPSGTPTARVALRNYPGETPVFDGGNASEWWMDVVAKDHTIFEGLTVQNYKGVSGLWIGHSGSGTNWSSFNIVRNMTFKNHGNDIWHDQPLYISHGNTDITVENNTVINAAASGMVAGHIPALQRGIFRNNIIVGGHFGIIFRDGPVDVHVYNNVVIGTPSLDQGCIEVVENVDGPGPPINPVIRNNIVYNCEGRAGIATEGSINPTVSHNLFFNTPNPEGVFGENAIIADPLFVNPAVSDYHLQAGSPAVDSGISIGAPSLDADGFARPQAAGVDRGAYER
jgi:Bacterial TSP3 repeat